MLDSKGNIIAELRKEAGYTQKTLAEALHVTDKAVSKWERGLSLPDASLLSRLSLLLGADISLLLAFDGKRAHEGWCGLIDLRNYSVNFSQIIYDKPLVYYPLSILLLAGIREILVISTPEDLPIYERLLGDGSQLGVSFSYKVQEKPRGLADAFILGEEFIGDDSVCLVLGDNFFYGQNMTKILRDAIDHLEGATIF